MVLLGAQVTDPPVIALASGGRGDAFQPGLNGVSPDAESAEALGPRLRWLLDDPDRLAAMGRAAARWSWSRFDPDAHAALAAAGLLDGDGTAHSEHSSRKLLTNQRISKG